MTHSATTAAIPRILRQSRQAGSSAATAPREKAATGKEAVAFRYHAEVRSSVKEGYFWIKFPELRGVSITGSINEDDPVRLARETLAAAIRTYEAGSVPADKGKCKDIPSDDSFAMNLEVCLDSNRNVIDVSRL